MPALASPDLAPLLALAAAQHGVVLRKQVLSNGWSRAELERAVRRGELLPCGYGGLCVAAETNPEHLYARRCAARLLGLTGDVVVSHESAALLLELPYVDPPAYPTLTRARAGAVEHRSGIHTASVPAAHRIPGPGLPITSGPRTLVDLLRNAPDALTAQGLADGGLRNGVPAQALDEVLSYCAGWPGIAQARAAVAFAEPRCESPLESRCRIWLRDGGLPRPTPQFLVRRPGGGAVGRVDLCFEDCRVVVEADGKVKFSPDAPWRRPNDEPLWDEKRREDALRDLGFEVVRAYWSDGDDGGADLVRRVRAAMVRAADRAAWRR